MIYAGFLILVLVASFFMQDLVRIVPALFGVESWGHGLAQGRPLVLVAFFFPACLSVPYPAMLALAFATGFLWDCHEALVWGNTSPGFGAGPLLLGLVGSVVHGVRPLFRERRWGIVSLASTGGTFLFLLFDYLWINFRAGGFAFPPGIWGKIGFTTLYTGLLSVAFLFVLVRALHACGHGGIFAEEEY